METPSVPVVPQGSSTRKTILIVAIVVVLLCCCCAALAGAGVVAYNYMQSSQSDFLPFPEEEFEPWLEETPFPFPFDEATPQIVETPESYLPEPTEEIIEEVYEEPTAEPTVVAGGGGQGNGLGVTRSAMVDFFNMGDAFEFSEPAEIQGMEYVQGAHSSLCVAGDCASVVLAGPEEDLTVITVVVPTDPDDTIQSLTAITLLMTAVSQFTDQSEVSALPTQMMSDIIEAQKAGTDLEETFEENGYMFLETYNATTHIAGIAISRPQ